MIFVFASLALLSFVLMLWQWIVATRFPLHQRVSDASFAPPVTLLKPIKGADSTTKETLRSWFAQNYSGEVQILFGVAAENDPACEIVRELQKEFPTSGARLIVCPESLGANAKVSKLIQLFHAAKHEIIVVSDADVRVPQDFLSNAVVPLTPALSPSDGERVKKEVGLVNCFYRFANPATLAMQWEAVATNADFWSQVLQSRSLRPMDFALGAAMVTRRKQIQEIGGFEAIVNCLADDYQLGNRIAKKGYRIELSPVIVECWDAPNGWRDIWKHQIRWARTIRVCQPVPYFFSILSNVTLWALVWLLAELFAGDNAQPFSFSSATGDSTVTFVIQICGLFPALIMTARIFGAIDLQRRLERNWSRASYFWLVPVKDLLQALVWLLAFAGNKIEWRGEKYRLRRDGTLEKLSARTEEGKVKNFTRCEKDDSIH